jgi:hypothetical protein
MSDKSELLKKSREKYIKDVCKSTWQIHPQIPIFRTLVSSLSVIKYNVQPYLS